MSIKLVLTLAMLSLLLVGKAGVLADHSALQTTQPLTQSQNALPWYQTQVNDALPQVNLDAAQTMTVTNDLDSDHDLNDDHATPHTDKADDDADETLAASQPVITLAAAQQVAEAYVHAGRATKVELEHDDGQWIYQVRINNVKVKVDAFTGRVLKAKIDD